LPKSCIVLLIKYLFKTISAVTNTITKKDKVRSITKIPNSKVNFSIVSFLSLKFPLHSAVYHIVKLILVRECEKVLECMEKDDNGAYKTCREILGEGR